MRPCVLWWSGRSGAAGVAHPLGAAGVAHPLSLSSSTIQPSLPLIYTIGHRSAATTLCNTGFSFAAFPPLLAAFFSIDLGAPKIGSLLTLTSSLQHRSIIAALWVATRQFVHERSGLLPPSLAPPSIYPSFLSPQLSLQLAKQAYSLIPSYFQPNYFSPHSEFVVTPGCYQDHTVSRVLTLEQEGHPQFHGPVPVLAMSVPDAFPICILPSDSPVTKHLFRFQQLCPRVPNCTLQFQLCSPGYIHGYLTPLLPLLKDSLLHIGDPPAHDNDFILHFDGGSFRELKLGGAGVILWEHSSGKVPLSNRY